MNASSKIRIWLFTAGNAPNSRMAVDNLNLFVEKNGLDNLEIETVDVLEDTLMALEHSIFVTPALIIGDPETGTVIYGDLSDFKRLKTAFNTEMEKDDR